MNDQGLIDSYFRTRLFRDASRTAIVDYDTGITYSYSDLADRAGRLIRFLREDIEIQRGDRIAFLARNGVYYLDAILAMPPVGGILTAYNYMLRTDELEVMIRKERPKIFFYESAFRDKIDRFRTILPETVFIVLDAAEKTGDCCYEAIQTGLPDNGSPICSKLNMESTVMLLHTGGTTGLPKAAMVPYRALIFNSIAQMATFGITYTDAAYISFPFFHGGAWNYALTLLFAGGRIYLKKKFSEEETLRMVARERLTMLAGAPTVFSRIAASKDFSQTDFSSVRMIRCGSASPTLSIMEKYWAKGLLFYNGYGMTEAGFGILALPAYALTNEEMREKAGSVGKEMLFSQVKLVDDIGCDVVCGQYGELLVRGELLFAGYWEEEAETAQAMRDGWFRTGDIARRDEDGFYYICGRKKNMFISGGEKIYTAEVENVLLTHSGVEDACVIGVKDRHWGEVGKAIVQLKPGVQLNQEQLRVFMKANISTIKIPKYYEFTDRIPRNEAGKLMGDVINQRYRNDSETI